MFSSVDYTKMAPSDLRNMLQNLVELERAERYCTLSLINTNTQEMLDVLNNIFDLLKLVEFDSNKEKELKAQSSLFKVPQEASMLYASVKEVLEKFGILSADKSETLEKQIENAVFHNLNLILCINKCIDLFPQKELQKYSVLQEELSALQEILNKDLNNEIHVLQQTYLKMQTFANLGLEKKDDVAAPNLIDIAALNQAIEKWESLYKGPKIDN